MTKQFWIAASLSLITGAGLLSQPASAQPRAVNPASFNCFWDIAEYWSMAPDCRLRPSRRVLATCITTCTNSGDKLLVAQLKRLEDACEVFRKAQNNLIEMGMMTEYVAADLIYTDEIADGVATAEEGEAADWESQYEIPAYQAPVIPTMSTYEMPGATMYLGLPSTVTATPSPLVPLYPASANGPVVYPGYPR